MTQKKSIILEELLRLTGGDDEAWDLYQEFKDYPGDTLDLLDAQRCYNAIVRIKRADEHPDGAARAEMDYNGFVDEDGSVEDSEPESDLLPSERFFGAKR